MNSLEPSLVRLNVLCKLCSLYKMDNCNDFYVSFILNKEVNKILYFYRIHVSFYYTLKYVKIIKIKQIHLLPPK